MAISRFLKQLIPVPPYPDPPRPDSPICVVGDLHGCDVLLERMLAKLAALPDAANMRVIFAGDMVDRGPGSAAVLGRLQEMTETTGPFFETICLMGNHERMMLDFIDDPVRNGARWLSNGGDKTLESFGLSSDRFVRNNDSEGETSVDNHPLVALRDALLNAMPKGMHDWLLERPLMWTEDRLAVTHAGAKPNARMDQQSEKHLLWGHREFRHRRRDDGLWIVHGHFIVSEPVVAAGRIAVDTGAYHTGRLTAVQLNADGLRFHETRTGLQDDRRIANGSVS
ncbi:MAG: metallophosphoesterase [Rhodobacteraceae bacterium]|nr:metallophosphoesterase [Paracoccaceae bacterium]MCF8515775.1 metallophosphoesterase [Paracoccaceae bacterium]MCF8520020.1 metallophosphoesterase [Paracoccaceae bacterium]